jgi:hypothetical protein
MVYVLGRHFKTDGLWVQSLWRIRFETDRWQLCFNIEVGGLLLNQGMATSIIQFLQFTIKSQTSGKL